VRRRRARAAYLRHQSKARAQRLEDAGRSAVWRSRRFLFLLFLAVFSLIAVLLYNISQSPLPAAAPLAQTSYLLDDAGHPLAAYGDQSRVEVPYSQIPAVVVNAVVSTEDRHFFTEGAINPISILRAVIADAQGGSNLQGASTITQQYVKNVYLSSERTVGRKLQEVNLAIKLGHRETKQQILDGYLNTIYLGRGAYGIEAAAQAYFGKDVSQLNLADASLLAGLIREPDNANPSTDPALARQHQTETLNDMIRDRKITRSQAAAVEAVPFSRYVLPPSKAAPQGPLENVPGDGYFLAAVYNQLVATYGSTLVNQGGLRVTTTLNPTLQAEAYNSIYGNNPPQLNPSANGDPSGSLVSMDNSGAVLAMVGGQDYNSSQVNLALGTAGGGSGRQPGSTFKAFMLAELLKEGYTPDSLFSAPGELIVPHGNANGTPWTVTNFEGEASSTQLSVVQATAESINTIYAQIVEKLGPQNLDKMAEECGISPAELAGAFPSQVLGSADVSPLEMTAAYNTFSDNGVYNAPLLFTKVTTSTGKVLPLPARAQGRVVLSPQQDAELDKVLQQVVLDPNGTGGAAGGIGTPIAGKTGTTDNSANAWFIGYTPHVTTAVWMGYASGNIPMVNFRGSKSIQGGGIPAQLWHDYMAQAVRAAPQLGGPFPVVYNYTGNVLQPPDPSTLQFVQNAPTTTSTTVGPNSPTGNSGGSGPFAGSSTPTVPTTTPTATTVPSGSGSSSG
jgi:membrane peptidoglycan carboxypeptidase